MASRTNQVVPATNTKNKGILTHLRHEPVITLALLRAPREESPRKYFESLTFDADSSSSCPITMQVMTISVTSIKEQLTQLSEAIARLTKTVEDKDLQITMLVNRLEAHHDNKADPKVDPPKEETDENEKPLVEKVKEKLDQAASLMRSLSI
ncbi:hypothetical protein ACFX1T_029699 [Malus domestica]